ncbi:hypothetical protein ACQBAR_11165 [Propionibacteriaceae bacterium Y1685]
MTGSDPVESPGDEEDRTPQLFAPPTVYEPAEGVLEVRWAEPAFPLMAGLLVVVSVIAAVGLGLSSPPWAAWPILLLVMAALVAGAVALYRARQRLLRLDAVGLLETRPGSPFGTRHVAWEAVDDVSLQRARGPLWMLRLHTGGRSSRMVLLDGETIEPIKAKVEHWTGRPVRVVPSPWDETARRQLRGGRPGD